MYKTKFIKSNWDAYFKKNVGKVDSILLAKNIENDLNEMKKQGYEMVSIQSVISGNWGYDSWQDGGFGWGYGYTNGVIIIYKKDE